MSEAPPQAMPRTRRIRAVDHAIDVLEAMSAASRPVGVSEIARQTGLSKATVHHLLATLETRRFVMRDADSALYKLSWALYELGSNVVRDIDVSRIARPYLDKLAVETGESVLLAILDEHSVLYLDRGEAPAGLQMRANAGRRSPLHATASGKVLLAFANDSLLLDEVLSGPLERLTKTTITDPSILRYELAEARRRGYATCWQEREIGLCSVGVPLRDYRGSVVAALTVAGPSIRLTTFTLQQRLGPLMATACRIEAHLGARSPA